MYFLLILHAISNSVVYLNNTVTSQQTNFFGRATTNYCYNHHSIILDVKLNANSAETSLQFTVNSGQIGSRNVNCMRSMV